jgi:cytochrome c-type biogenesis protein CcmF
MASLGYYLLLAAFVASAYAVAMSVAGARRRSRRLIESGAGAFYLVAAIMMASSAVMVHAFVSDNFAIKYVHRYSEAAQPLFYKLTAYWGGLDGSIMFWVALLSLFGAAAVYANRERHRELTPYVVAVISGVQMFFLLLMIVHNNPFETYLTETHADGRGLNPLLQNFYMVIHPPTMYLGFVGITIPFAFGMAALITGLVDDAWLRAVRRWTMIAWLFLTLGLMLGMLWAYEELGWGGYWMWDPVENAALLPWFTATAFLHSVMVQERRGMLRIWNVSLVIVTFFLTIFGTFMTRSGVVQSVHAFGEDPELARMFVIFMIGLLVSAFGLVIYRLPLLRSRNELDSWVSREAAFLVNNWVMLFSAFFVLFATMFPTLSEWVRGERLTVAELFFNQWMTPVGLLLLFLTGVGPLLAWRKSSLLNLRDQFLFPVGLGVATVIGTTMAGISFWAAGLCFALCALVLGTITQEFWRGARVRQQTTGTDLFTALIGLVGRNKRRYGGYLAHVGVVLIFFGFAGREFRETDKAALQVGQEARLGDVTFRMENLTVTEDDQKQSITAQIGILKNGESFATLYPARWFFHKHEQPTTEVAIRRGIDKDVYIVLGNWEADTQTAMLELWLVPLVNWIWVGFAVVALGTIIALMPETVFAFATTRVAAQAATTALLLLSLGLLPLTAHAQGRATARGEQQELRAKLEGRIMCTCGCRRPLNDCGMINCGGHAAQTAKMEKLLAEGKSEEEIVAIFVRDAGSQDVLAAPLNEGFNRLAWFVPYAVGLIALVGIFLTARRWARPAHAIAGDAGRLDPTLDARLDDELRNLD